MATYTTPQQIEKAYQAGELYTVNGKIPLMAGESIVYLTPEQIKQQEASTRYRFLDRWKVAGKAQLRQQKEDVMRGVEQENIRQQKARQEQVIAEKYEKSFGRAPTKEELSKVKVVSGKEFKKIQREESLKQFKAKQAREARLKKKSVYKEAEVSVAPAPLAGPARPKTLQPRVMPREQYREFAPARGAPPARKTDRPGESATTLTPLQQKQYGIISDKEYKTKMAKEGREFRQEKVRQAKDVLVYDTARGALAVREKRIAGFERVETLVGFVPGLREPKGTLGKSAKELAVIGLVSYPDTPRLVTETFGLAVSAKATEAFYPEQKGAVKAEMKRARGEAYGVYGEKETYVVAGVLAGATVATGGALMPRVRPVMPGVRARGAPKVKPKSGPATERVWVPEPDTVVPKQKYTDIKIRREPFKGGPKITGIGEKTGFRQPITLGQTFKVTIGKRAQARSPIDVTGIFAPKKGARPSRGQKTTGKEVVRVDKGLDISRPRKTGKTRGRPVGDIIVRPSPRRSDIGRDIVPRPDPLPPDPVIKPRPPEPVPKPLPPDPIKPRDPIRGPDPIKKPLRDPEPRPPEPDPIRRKFKIDDDWFGNDDKNGDSFSENITNIYGKRPDPIGGGGGGRGFKWPGRTGRRRTQYTPSIAAATFGIYGTPTKKKGFTGLEFRPLPGKPADKGKKKKKKKDKFGVGSSIKLTKFTGL